MDKYIITMLGEKDHGKSTLIGSILIATGGATEHRINEAKKYSKGGRFEPGYILDSFSEEREQEMTIDTTRAETTYNNNLIEFVDVPGHLELIKNMMSGASHGEIAILMLSMKRGEGLQPQTKRHIYIASMLGVKGLLVATNKMDLVGYSEIEFKKMKESISDYLKAIEFTHPVVFVPVSAYGSENLVKPSDNMFWYRGKPLMEELSSLLSKKKASEGKGKGLRGIVQDVVEDNGRDMVFCFLSSGSIKVGQQIKVEPLGEAAKVAEIYLKGEKTSNASKGSNVALLLEGIAEVKRGFVICGANEKMHSRKVFKSKIFFIKGLKAKDIEIKLNNNSVGAKIIKVDKVISPITGESKSGSTLAAGSAAIVEIQLKQNYPVERVMDYSELGRFAVYSQGEFVGIGVVV